MVSIHVKKNILFLFYLIFNASLAVTLLLVDNGFIYVSFFIISGHVRDFINVVIQVLFLFKIVKKLPEIPDTEKNTICCMIPVYNEDKDLVERNMASLTSQNLSSRTQVFLLMIFDGISDKNRDLFAHIESIISFDKKSTYTDLYENWKTKEESVILYKVGLYNNVQVVLSYKTGNAGKKDSLIVGERFCNNISRVEDISMDEVGYIFHTDGDTLADENCLNELLKTLVHDKTLDGVSGMLRAYGKISNTMTQKAFVYMQSFQYQFSLIVRRQTESLMNSTTCLPGCCNMIRMGEKTDFALEKYTNLPKKEVNLLQTISRLQGTDRRYTTLLLKQGGKLKMNWRASVYTEPPLDSTSFINQRRRWASNSFFNSVVLLYSKNIPLYIRVSTFIDVCKIFSTIFRFFSYFVFWIFLDRFSTLNIIFAVLFLAAPYVYALLWMVCITPKCPSLFIGLLMNKILMPFLSIVSVSKMYMTSTNFAWGTLNDKKKAKAVKVNESDKASSVVPVVSLRGLDFSEFDSSKGDTFEYHNSGGMIEESIGRNISSNSRKKFQVVHPGLETMKLEFMEEGVFVYYEQNPRKIRPMMSSLSSLSLSSSEGDEEKHEV